uniref:Uncharacterized protein n=1 Tax=Mustela putorius furo TaxID=9669 RepID=M3Y3Z9_MUSPF
VQLSRKVDQNSGVFWLLGGAVGRDSSLLPSFRPRPDCWGAPAGPRGSAGVSRSSTSLEKGKGRVLWTRGDPGRPPLSSLDLQ